MADSWLKRAAKGDGTYRLAFDQPESVSLKYNAVWDKVFGTQVFPNEIWEPEIASYRAGQNRYGMPLDNRAGIHQVRLVGVERLYDGRPSAFSGYDDAFMAFLS